ncbi:hypothetical protein [Rhodobacter capsulatus]|uniref:hypothetical protein n=1 Tax=Rhodobacter capsulatus TaxID=1061 RepID=UPI0040299C57
MKQIKMRRDAPKLYFGHAKALHGAGHIGKGPVLKAEIRANQLIGRQARGRGRHLHLFRSGRSGGAAAAGTGTAPIPDVLGKDRSTA